MSFLGDINLYNQWMGSTDFKKYLFGHKEEITSIVDIGANTGAAALFFADILPRVPQILFEPDAENFKLLLKNINGLSNITPYNIGIYYGAEESTVQGTGDGNTGGYTLSIIENKHKTQPSNTYSTYIGKIFKLSPLENYIQTADLIKIDCEVSEYNILENSIAVHSAKVIHLELHAHDIEYYLHFIDKYLPEFSIIRQNSLGSMCSMLLEKKGIWAN